MDDHSYLSNSSPEYIDSLFKDYKNDPSSVEPGWRHFFEGFDFARTDFESDGEVPDNVMKEFKALDLIQGYRSRGHLFTKTNPVRERRKYSPTLALENYGLEQADLGTIFQAGTEIGIGPATLKDIVEHLETVYCQSIGMEYMFMRSPEKLNWLKSRLHETTNLPSFDKKEKTHIFDFH